MKWHANVIIPSMVFKIFVIEKPFFKNSYLKIESYYLAKTYIGTGEVSKVSVQKMSSQSSCLVLRKRTHKFVFSFREYAVPAQNTAQSRPV